MERAAALLRATSLSNEEVAYMVGYGNTSNFCKAFKKYYGTTPALMKAKAGESSDAKP